MGSILSCVFLRKFTFTVNGLFWVMLGNGEKEPRRIEKRKATVKIRKRKNRYFGFHDPGF